jgi:superoxide dismutase, Cu-Zn family
MKTALPVILLATAGLAHADYTVDMKSINQSGQGASIGTVTITAHPSGGATFTPKLKGLPAGQRGFHVHEKASCGPAEKGGKMVAGESAGAHWDPDKSGKHGAPKGPGHRGDLPALEVAADGTATKAVTAPRLKLADLARKSLMIHAGGDNYSDSPKPSGGGGDRIACGLITGK